MKLLINTATTHKGGSVQVAKSFIDSCRNSPEHDYIVVLGLSLAKMMKPEEFPANFQFFNIDYRPATRVLSLQSRSRFFRKIEDEYRPDVVFTTSGPSYWRPKAPHLVGYNLPHHIYPESKLFETWTIRKRLRWRLKTALILHFFMKDADAYVVQTDSVNERVRRFLNTDNVHTVSNTCGAHYFGSKPFPSKLPPRTPGEFRLLSLSAWYLHKNLLIIPKVIDMFPDKIRDLVRFVLTLPPKDYAENFSDTCKQSIINIGPVPVEQGPSIYSECDAMFLPTLLECFSASYPEAMAMQRPILTSDLDFARSICQDAAMYFDPLNPASIAEQICTLMESADLQSDLVTKGQKRLHDFGTAEERAAHYLGICEELAGFKR